MQLAVATVVLLGVLAVAVGQPRRVPEAAVAVPAAALLVAVGILPARDAAGEVRRLAPTVGFLAAVLVLAHLCDADGLFTAAGAVMGRACRGQPRRLLGLVFGVAAAVTAVLSLDATVVLLTPVVFATAARLGLRAGPHVYACTHLANTASLLLPVSNLINLLAFGASGLSFAGFGALMALPWLVAIAVEYVVLRRFFDTDLAAPARPVGGPAARVPVLALAVVGATLVAFGLTSLAGVNPAWAAAAGAGVLAVRGLATRRVRAADVVRAAGVPFLLFVLALAVVVRAVEDGGLGAAVRRVVPTSSTLAGLLAVAVLAALLANLVNNLPAVLVLLPSVTGRSGLVLAVLVGVNVGPNLTYVGSLATLLWRRVLRSRRVEPALGEFLRLGALSVPPALVGAVLALWAVLRVSGR